MSYDTQILHATETAWYQHQLNAAIRSRKFEIEHFKTREELELMTDEEYLRTRYFDEKDKKGIHHIRNMVASEMNGAKSKAGGGFEKAIMTMANETGVRIIQQVNINPVGNICPRKSVHRIDGYISNTSNPLSVKDCYVISKKTTLKERWNQDTWCIPLCKKVIIITRETPNDGTLASIREHGAIIVYPNAAITEIAWSYDEFFRRMKAFQDSSSDSTS